MNSTNLDYSVWVKVGQTFLNLFISGNRVIDCLVSSIVRSDVYFLVQDSAILFQWSAAALLQYTFVGTFVAKFRFLSDDVIALVCLTTQAKHLPTFELFFEEARLSLIMLFGFFTTCSEKRTCYSISSETIDTVLRSQPLSFSYPFRSDTIFQFIFGKSKYNESVSISNTWNLFTSQSFMKKL